MSEDRPADSVRPALEADASPTDPGSALGPGGEFDLIRSFLRAAGAADRPDVLVGPGDDAAVVDAGRIVVSVDLVIEDVHFRRDWITPEQIGYRAAAAALSDLAAMAARPVGLLASLAVTEADARTGLAGRIVNGLIEAARDADAALLGGDLTRSPGPIALDVVVLGSADRPALRSGAEPGDEVWVTGRLGAAAAAVASWQAGEEPDAAAKAAYARPKPRIAEARWLAERELLHALIDVSDGIAGDAGHLAAASGTQLVIDADRVPAHESASADPALALGGGDDYELLFTAPAGSVEPRAAAFEKAFGVSLTRIGEVRRGAGVRLRDAQGEREPGPGYSHFRT